MFGPGLSGIHLLPEELSKYSGEKKKKPKHCVIEVILQIQLEGREPAQDLQRGHKRKRKNEQQLPGSAQEASQGRRQALGSQLLLQQTRQPTPARPGCPEGHAEHRPAFWTWRSGRPVVTTSHRQELPARHFCPASSGAHTRERGVVSIWGSGPPLE